jgi:hypothetical protein
VRREQTHPQWQQKELIKQIARKNISITVSTSSTIPMSLTKPTRLQQLFRKRSAMNFNLRIFATEKNPLELFQYFSSSKLTSKDQLKFHGRLVEEVGGW